MTLAVGQVWAFDSFDMPRLWFLSRRREMTDQLFHPPRETLARLTVEMD